MSAEKSDKESAISRELQEAQRISKAFDETKDKLSFVKRRQALTRDVLNDRYAAISHINTLMEEAEADRLSNSAFFQITAAERDLLGALLARKNDEVVLLHEKATTLLTTLREAGKKFEAQLRLLGFMVADTAHSERVIATISSSRNEMRELKRELFLAQQHLIREQARVKQLSNYAEDPANLGRWREINIGSVNKKTILGKVQALQKRLIHATELSVELSLDVQEREKQIME